VMSAKHSWFIVMPGCQLMLLDVVDQCLYVAVPPGHIVCSCMKWWHQGAADPSGLKM